jgi:hypothetical protein
MSQATEAPVSPIDADGYHRIQQFYASQMHLLDEGRARQWAETFAPEGVFAANAQPEPVRGRAAIAAAAARTAAGLAADGVQRRHWIGMLDAAADGDKVRVRSYALIFETPAGGAPSLRMSTLCIDTLIPEADSWLVLERVVTRDDLR